MKKVLREPDNVKRHNSTSSLTTLVRRCLPDPKMPDEPPFAPTSQTRRSLSDRVRIQRRVTTSLELPPSVDLGQGDEISTPRREP